MKLPFNRLSWVCSAKSNYLVQFFHDLPSFPVLFFLTRTLLFLFTSIFSSTWYIYIYVCKAIHLKKKLNDFFSQSHSWGKNMNTKQCKLDFWSGTEVLIFESINITVIHFGLLSDYFHNTNKCFWRYLMAKFLLKKLETQKQRLLYNIF